MELKKLTNYFLIFLLFSFMGCQKDDIYMNETSTEASATMTKISFSQIKSDPKHRRVAGTVDEFTKSIKLKHNTTGRLVYNEEYGFYIDEENGIYIEDGEKHSYTFRIERPETGDKVENIVFTPDGNGGYKTMLVRYDIDKDEYYTLTEAEIKERNVELAEYDPTAKDFSILICIYVKRFETYVPHRGELVGEFQPIEVREYYVWDCDFIGGGSSGGSGGGDGGSSGPGGGGGGNTGPNSPPVVTTPVVKTPQNEDPCINLKDLLDPEKLNLDLYINGTNTTNGLADMFEDAWPKEASFSFKLTMQQNGEYGYGSTYDNGTETAVQIQTGTAWFSAIHLHPKKTKAAGGIFSWLDIRTLGHLYESASQNNRESNNVSLLLLCPNPATSTTDDYNIYALTVKNMHLLRGALDAEWFSPKWAPITDEKRRIDAIQNDLGRAYTENYHNLENYFLQRFSGYGISLYKLEDNNWKELVPTSTPGQPLKKPCN